MGIILMRTASLVLAPVKEQNYKNKGSQTRILRRGQGEEDKKKLNKKDRNSQNVALDS